MREIPLTDGYVALVDDEDYVCVSRHVWHLLRHKNHGCLYARTGERIGGKQVLLHRFILGLWDSAPHVDHRNGNGLDCRRANLRVASYSQNAFNRKSVNASGYKGVCKKGERWYPRIGKEMRFKSYPTLEEAARAYDGLAKARYGKFARLNFPETMNELPILRGPILPRRKKRKGLHRGKT